MFNHAEREERHVGGDAINGGIDDRDSSVTEVKLRRWLARLRQPDRLDDPELARLLRAHGRLPETSSAIEFGRAAAALIKDKIEALRAPPGAGRAQQLPHLVLETCFVDGAKLFQAAGRLGLSERQLTRERSRAIGLLKAELETAATARSYRPEPIPAIGGFMARPAQTRAVKAALEKSRHVNVGGAPGIGKTSLVAALASEAASSSSVFWYKFRPGMNAALSSILFDVGEYVASENVFDLADYMDGALPSPDNALATRLALRGLDGRPRLLVFDDYHVAEENEPVLGFLEEVAARLPLVRVITVGRRRLLGAREAVTVEIAPFTRSETTELLTRLKVSCSTQMIRRLHAWTRGNPHLLKLAASWLKSATDDEVARGISSLEDQLEVQTFLLSNVTELLDSDDRALLEAASIFRDRFSDEALGFVSQRTRGAVLDAGIRLVRAYVATRSLDGEGAFFHASVRDYVYERLDAQRKSFLHARACLWYERAEDDREADYHRRRAEPDALG